MPSRLARPLREAADLDPLLERIGDARYVLIGEASHGTHEYYAWRALLTQRLVAEKGFSFVAVEGDWPDCYDVTCSVTLEPEAPTDPGEALAGFDRWPTWMWANTDVVDFCRWLREHNAGLPPQRRVGFYGLDVYSLWESLHATLDYIAEHHPEHVHSVRAAFRCFEPYAEDPAAYARSTALLPSGCEPEVSALLRDLRATAPPGPDGARDATFNAEQNARALAGAEAYYRAVMRGGPGSWNVRDRHMVQTLDRLVERHGPEAKAVVWAHNTHVGDARWTDMAQAGMVNVGQLVREQHAQEGVVIVGLGGHHGRVLAGDYWGAPARAIPMPAARPGSTEARLHESLGEGSRAVFLFDDGLPSWAEDPHDHRAVGVVYDPGRERWGNYVPTVLGRRYDAFLWFDATSPLTPLHGEPEDEQEPETWPTGV